MNFISTFNDKLKNLLIQENFSLLEMKRFKLITESLKQNQTMLSLLYKGYYSLQSQLVIQIDKVIQNNLGLYLNKQA